MSRRREQVLARLGLGPRWHLRAGFGAGSDPRLRVAVSAGTFDQSAPTENLPSQPTQATPEANPVAAPALGPVPERAAVVATMDWTELRDAVGSCQACRLCGTRKQAVFGVGDQGARWMVIGEAPGAEEDERGEPFVGQAGRLLDNMLLAIGLRRGDGVYIANVLKCRPPGNRNPEPTEVASCTPHLARQIALIRPRILLAVGKFAAQYLLQSDAPVGRLRGRVHQHAGIPLVVTYHPAYLLRNLPAKAEAWADLCLARQTLQEHDRDNG